MADNHPRLLGDKPLGWYDFMNYSYCDLCGDRIPFGQRWCNRHDSIWKRWTIRVRRALETLDD